MRWTVGADHIHRATFNDVRAEISLCSGRSSWRVRVFKDSELKFDRSPYFQMRRARKSAEDIMGRVGNAKEADLLREE